MQAKLPADANNAAARGYLVLAGDPNRSLELVRIGDLRIIGMEQLLSHLRRLERTLSVEQIERLAAGIANALPEIASPARANGDPADAIAEPSKIFDKAHRLYYLSAPWRRAGHHRLYLSDQDGTALGWTDVNTRVTDISCDGQEADVARVLLASADPSGVKLAHGDLPKMPVKIIGGRILGRVARFHTSVLIGQEYRGRGKHHLYGTLIDPAVASFKLGHVDLRSGTVHPAVDGPLAKDRGPADRYLEILHLRRPTRSRPWIWGRPEGSIRPCQPGYSISVRPAAPAPGSLSVRVSCRC